MNILKSYCGTLILFFFILGSCEKEETVPQQNNEVEPHSALDYYNKGLDTRDPDEKLHFYNEGLKVVKGIEDTMLVSLLEGKAYAFFKKRNIDSASKVIDSLLIAAEIQKDTFFLSKGLYRKSLVFRYLNQPDLSFEYAFKARRLNLRAGDTALAARRSLDMANAQIEMGDYTGSQVSATEALKYLNPKFNAQIEMGDNTGSQVSAKEALKYLNPEFDSIFMSATYNLIGLAYLDQGFYQDAIKEYNNALEYAVRTKDSLTFRHNIAIALKNQGKYDEAIEILEEIVKSDYPDSISKSRYIDNLAFAYWTKDPSAQIDSLLFKALEMRKQLNDLEGLHSSYDHLADYFQEKDEKRALDYAKKSYETAAAATAYSAELKALKKLIPLVDGNEKSAYIERYVYLDDSLDKASSKAKYHFAKVRYDEEQKEEEIFHLEVKNFNQALEAERLQNRNIIYLLSILVVLLIAGLLLYSTNQRNKRKRLKEVYLTESRMSKRIHDELANEVYNLMSKFEAKGDAETVHTLDLIYRKTRDISREISQIDTGENFDKALISNLSSNAGDAKLILRGENAVDWGKVSEEKKIVIYRVLQELLVNMKKHSDASFVAIAFNLTGNHLYINYSDNGKGMVQEETRYGNGFMNIQYRLNKVNGEISYDTEPGKGFKASIDMRI